MSTHQNILGHTLDQLGEAIVSGRYAPGSAIPPEPVLGEAFGVSRTVVREAIKSLVDCGAIRTDRSLEEYLRQRYRLPVKDAPTTMQPKEGE